jgi:hypothetical protein
MSDKNKEIQHFIIMEKTVFCDAVDAEFTVMLQHQ